MFDDDLYTIVISTSLSVTSILAVLLLGGVFLSDTGSAAAASENLSATIARKMDRVSLPGLPSTDIPSLAEIIEYLRIESGKPNTTTTEISRKGVNFVLVGDGDQKMPAHLEFKLKDMPLSAALRQLPRPAE